MSQPAPGLFVLRQRYDQLSTKAREIFQKTPIHISNSLSRSAGQIFRHWQTKRRQTQFQRQSHISVGSIVVAVCEDG
jgi:hypothetical protein